MRTVVMTGGTSGFGRLCVEALRAAGTHVILGSRRPDTGLLLDMTSLASVRDFAAQVGDRVGPEPIDALVLNAGVIRRDAMGRSADGYETTFAVNHLAHYLLLRLLLDRCAEGATVVLTTSGTHDPETRGGPAPPRHADARLLADPARDATARPDTARGGQEAYTASKLCTVLTVKTLAGDPSVMERRLTVLAFCPGQVFGTGLVTDLPLPRQIAWKVMGTPVSAPLRHVVPTLNTAATAGSALARLALGQVPVPEGRTYVALRRGRLTWPEPSVLARDDDAARTLWRDSADLVGLPG